MKSYQRSFIGLAREIGALEFGRFELKSGRVSPYFFNSGRFSSGRGLAGLGTCYARAIHASGIDFDMLYGAPYKGIPFVAATAVALFHDFGINIPYCFSRKEAKGHGERGVIVGAPLARRVLIIDDVITAGTAVRESVELILSAGAMPVGVVVALDRQERGAGIHSAIQEVKRVFGIEVFSIATLEDILELLGEHQVEPELLERIRDYRTRYGVSHQ